MTLWFSFQRYNLLNPDRFRLASAFELHPFRGLAGLHRAVINTLILVGWASSSSPSFGGVLLALLLDQPIWGQGHRAHPGDLALLRHAARRGADLEEHVHAPGNGMFADTCGSLLGLSARRFPSTRPAGFRSS
jgi:hypothetical protein